MCFLLFPFYLLYVSRFPFVFFSPLLLVLVFPFAPHPPTPQQPNVPKTWPKDRQSILKLLPKVWSWILTLSLEKWQNSKWHYRNRFCVVSLNQFEGNKIDANMGNFETEIAPNKWAPWKAWIPLNLSKPLFSLCFRGVKKDVLQEESSKNKIPPKKTLVLAGEESKTAFLKRMPGICAATEKVACYLLHGETPWSAFKIGQSKWIQFQLRLQLQVDSVSASETPRMWSGFAKRINFWSCERGETTTFFVRHPLGTCKKTSLWKGSRWRILSCTNFALFVKFKLDLLVTF